MKNIVLLFLAVFFIGCNKQEIQKLQEEKIQLKAANIKLESDLKTLNDSVMGITKEKDSCNDNLKTITKERDDYKAKAEALIIQQLNQEKKSEEKGM